MGGGVNDYLIRWQPSPLPGRLLAYVYAPDTYDEPNGFQPCGILTFTLEQLKDTLEAVGTALFSPELVTWGVWLRLMMAAGLAEAAINKGRANAA